MMKLDRVCFALGLIGLGVLSLVYGDFALQWQPVPDWLPARAYLAYAYAAIMIAFGAGLLSGRSATLVLGGLLAYSQLLLLVLNLPLVVIEPLVDVNWLG